MRKLIAIFTIMAFVVTTIAPGMAHASSFNHTKAAQSKQISMGHDCDHHDHAKADSHEKHDMNKKSCCDDGVCKCPGGACHSGVVKISGGASYLPLNLASVTTHYHITNESGDSAFPERLKRPPKA